MLVAGILWSFLGVSGLLAIVAAARRSWRLMLLAALFSLLFSLAAILSVGPLSLLLTGLELSLAVGMRRELSARSTFLVVLAAVAVWGVTVPLQVFVIRWPPLELLVPVALVTAIVAILNDPRRPRTASG